MTHIDTTEEGFVDTASRPETRGIELIEDEERHGRARDLFFIWAAPNVSILNLTIGATLILLGLEIWQAVLVILASALLWVLPGVIAASGPAAGTSGSVVTRAMYGILGNKLFVAFVGWFIGAVFLSLTWLASSFMGADLLRRAGLADPVWVPIVDALAAMCHALVCTTGPLRIAVGGGVMTAQPHLIAAVNRALLDSLGGYMMLPVDNYVVAPELGGLAGPLGAIAVAAAASEAEGNSRLAAE